MYDIIFKFDHENGFWCQLLEGEKTKCTELKDQKYVSMNQEVTFKKTTEVLNFNI